MAAAGILLLIAGVAGGRLAGNAQDARSVGVGENGAGNGVGAEGTERIDFNEHIRPILANHCMACHGGVMHGGGVSFLFREEAFATGDSGVPIIKPFDAEGSLLLDRVTDARDPMPPPDQGPMLDEESVALLRQWIEEGAEWKEPRAFMTPEKPPVPEPATGEWARNAVDHFILARLESEGLQPSPEATPEEWLRRVSLDLIGLPPTPAEVDAFLADDRPDAYERTVDRLLASPAYGERWASVWLDLARYADTKGYEKDAHRDVWPYRDWLVRALNDNMPYDRMLVEQIAGDLLSDATMDQRIATVFNRNTPTNEEGGTDNEEFRTMAVMDRVATVWQAFGGVTMQCVQCHSHPYDPIRHEEYFTFYAFFNSSLDADLGSEFPTLLVPHEANLHDEAVDLATRIREARHQVITGGVDLFANAETEAFAVARAVAARVEPEADVRTDGGLVEIVGTVASSARVEADFEPLGAGAVTAIRLDFPPEDPETARHSPEPGFVITRARVWRVAAEGGEAVEVPIRRVVADSADDPRDPRDLLADNAGGLAVEPVWIRERRVVLVPEQALELGPEERLRVELRHGVQISERPAVVGRFALATSGQPVWTERAHDSDWHELTGELAAWEARLAQMPGVRIPVMAEARPENQRATSLFVRGNWLEKSGEIFEPGVPGVFPPLPDTPDPNRLTLAEWMVGPHHPLTARVAVNRLWEQLFGIGIIETLEDFGSIGTPPSHPDLLDWLARTFQDDMAWDQKAMLRMLVTSATYRQSAAAGTEARERDPANRLLARGPRQRLSAEMFRDQALLAAGLLSSKRYGPPVMPPQPEGVWNVVYSGARWVESEGEDRYRRALYTYWRRTSPYPSLLTFDAPDRDICSVRRIVTNTPLQALITFNDPVFFEAATALANLMREENGEGGSPEQAIAYGWRRVATTPPDAEALAVLRELFDTSLAETGGDTGAAYTNVAAVLLNMDASTIR